MEEEGREVCAGRYGSREEREEKRKETDEREKKNGSRGPWDGMKEWVRKDSGKVQ